MAAKSSLWSRIKRVFIKGLATLLPTILTIYLFFWIFGFIRTNVSEPINSFFGKQLYSAEWGRSYLYDKFEIPFQDEAGKPLEGDALAKELTDKLPWWPGFVIAFVAVLGVGFFIASWLGRGLFKTGEGLIGRIPVVKVIYPYAKQVTDFVFGDKKTPEGIYQLGGRNARSKYYKSIHISYPNADDLKKAEQMGVDPGSGIALHGLPVSSDDEAWDYIERDWTDGCIAVTNEEMQEIWDLVDDPTPIVILP